MFPAEITNDALKLSDIPVADAPFERISQFGYTFNGFKQLGSFAACAEIANRSQHGSLTELRACLFFEQRRWHHFGGMVNADAENYQRELFEQIRLKVSANERA